MAGPARKVKREWSQTGPMAAMRALVEEHNKLVDDLEALRAHVVAETDATLAASALEAGKLETVESGEP